MSRIHIIQIVILKSITCLVTLGFLRSLTETRIIREITKIKRLLNILWCFKTQVRTQTGHQTTVQEDLEDQVSSLRIHNSI